MGKIAKTSAPPPDELSRSIASAVSMDVGRAVDQALLAIFPTLSVATTQEVCILCTDVC